MIDRVIQDITQYLTNYLGSAIIVAVIFSFGCFIISLFMMLKEPCHLSWKKWMHILLSLPINFAAVFYVFMVIIITFFSRIEGSVDVINLHLFSTFGNDLQSRLFIIENVIMFMPLGIFLRIYGVKRLWSAIVIMLGSSVSIEVMQYLTGRGRLEIDDVLTNMLGGITAYIIGRLIEKIINFVKQKSSPPCS